MSYQQEIVGDSFYWRALYTCVIYGITWELVVKS